MYSTFLVSSVDPVGEMLIKQLPGRLYELLGRLLELLRRLTELLRRLVPLVWREDRFTSGGVGEVIGQILRHRHARSRALNIFLL